jgi:hypothetical protein
VVDYGHGEVLPAVAADLVRRRPAAIVALQGFAALAAKAVTRDIPIILINAHGRETGTVEADQMERLQDRSEKAFGLVRLKRRTKPPLS